MPPMGKATCGGGHLNDNGVCYGNIIEPSPRLELQQFKQIALFLCEKS
jgi:hypothetical protein